MRRLRRPGSRSSLSTAPPSASRPTSDGGRDSGGGRGTRRAREGTSAGAQPRARGRTRPEIDASAISNSPQSASRPENPPCTGLRICPTRPPKAPQQVRYRGADLAIGPLWRLSPFHPVVGCAASSCARMRAKRVAPVETCRELKRSAVAGVRPGAGPGRNRPIRGPRWSRWSIAAGTGSDRRARRHGS